jgi:hypothetical protein
MLRFAMDAERCRQRAKRFLAQARGIPDPTLSVRLLDLAARWMALAERAEAPDSAELVWRQQEQPTQNSAREG